MSGVTYESLLRAIREAEEAAASREDPPAGAGSGAAFDELFPGRRQPGADADAAADTAAEPAPALFDLRIARLTSGWGAIVGTAAGAWSGLSGGPLTLALGAVLGLVLGSAAALAGLAAIAGAAARFGMAWGSILVGIAAALLLAATA